MATVQMNVRIDERLKAAGDSALARAGLTASEAVRDLWRYLAAWEKLPPEIEHMAQQAQLTAGALAADGPILADCNPVDEFYLSLGLDQRPLDDVDYAALRDELALEELEAWEAL